MLSSYIFENLKFTVLIIGETTYPLKDIKTQKNLDSFITCNIVEIILYDKKFEEKRYIMLQSNTQDLKEVDLANELFIKKTINEMYLVFMKNGLKK